MLHLFCHKSSAIGLIVIRFDISGHYSWTGD